MAIWVNHVAVAAPRNGTTTHTVSPASGTVVAGSAFTPTSGRFLLCLVEGSVTSTTPSGWTLPTNGSSINNTGLYVFTKTAAGSDTVTTTHNGSNYPVIFDFYEFAAGTTFVKAATSSGVAYNGGAGPTISSLTGTNMIFGVAGLAQTGATTITWTWGGGSTEAVDTQVAASGTDGYAYSTAYLEDSVLTSSSLAATASSNGGAGGTCERLMFAVQIPSGGTNVALTGAVADLDLDAPAGTLAAVSVVNVALTGTVADLTVSAPIGTVALATNVTLTGAAADLALTAPAGTVTASSTTGDINLTGAAADLTTAAPIGTLALVTNVSLTGAVAGLAIDASAGTVTADSVGNVALAGAVSDLTTAAPAGTVTTTSVINVALTGVAADLTVTAPAGSLTLSSVGDVSLVGQPADLSIGTPAGTLSIASNVTLIGTVATLDLVALAGDLALTSLIDLAGDVTGFVLTAPAGTWSGGPAPTDRDITIAARLTPSPWDAGITDNPWTADLTDSPWHAQTGDTMIAGSLEYAHVTITADHDITADTVEASFDERVTWHTMSHASGNVWRILIGPGQAVNPTSNDTVYVRVTDSPEIPIINAGRLYLSR